MVGIAEVHFFRFATASAASLAVLDRLKHARCQDALHTKHADAPTSHTRALNIYAHHHGCKVASHKTSATGRLAERESVAPTKKGRGDGPRSLLLDFGDAAIAAPRHANFRPRQ